MMFNFTKSKDPKRKSDSKGNPGVISSFFSSTKLVENTGTATKGVPKTWFIQPETIEGRPEDDLSLSVEEETAELSSQREKWSEFISKQNGDIWTEMDWLWERKHAKSRDVRESIVSTNAPRVSTASLNVLSNNVVSKKIYETLSMKKRQQKKLKKLVRGGVPPELRGEVWWCLSGMTKEKK